MDQGSAHFWHNGSIALATLAELSAQITNSPPAAAEDAGADVPLAFGAVELPLLHAASVKA
ncbi:MAG: hypothetical protein WBP09_01595, partial [Propionicimonas sp.]